MREEDRRRNHAIVAIILIGLALLIGGLVWWYCTPVVEEDEDDDHECPEFEFGDDDLNAEIKPNASLEYPEVEPYGPHSTGHWEDSYYYGDEVDGYIIGLAYRVNITAGIDSTSVAIKIKVWATITNPYASTTLNGEPERELVLDEDIDVDTFAEWVDWESDSLDLPEDNSQGGCLEYTFDILVEVSGDIIATTLTLKHTLEEDHFDTFKIYWEVDWIMTVGLLGGIAGAIVGIGVALKIRKNKKCDCIGQPNCYCDL